VNYGAWMSPEEDAILQQIAREHLAPKGALWNGKHKTFTEPVNRKTPKYAIVKYALQELMRRYGFEKQATPDAELRAQLRARRVL
jgi:hypothetical protein